MDNNAILFINNARVCVCVCVEPSAVIPIINKGIIKQRHIGALLLTAPVAGVM